MTIDGGTVDLTGGDVEGVGDEADADLAFFFGLNNMNESKNENYAVNFTGPGSIIVDESGIIAPVKDENEGWTDLDPVEYEALWDMGILQAFGQSGVTGADFTEFFSVEGALGSANYTLTSLIPGGGGNVIGDCSGDGSLDVMDFACISTVEERNAVLSELGTLAGDFNGDVAVDVNDFLLLSRNFNATDVGYANGDANIDGVVDVSDFLELSRNFGKTVSASAVPEPATSLMAVVAALVGLTLRRRRR